MLELSTFYPKIVETQRRIALGTNSCRSGWHGPQEGEGCRKYHTVYPLLQELGVASGPSCHADFYQSALTVACGFMGSPHSEILVCGQATPATAILVHETCPNSPLTVLDICPTPLLATRELLPTATTLQSDVLCPPESLQGQFRTVITDALLTRFKLDERLQVIANIAGFLQPGGCLITTWKIGNQPPDQTSAKYGADFDQHDFFITASLQAIKKGIPLDFGKLCEIFDYAHSMTSFGGQTPEEIQAELRTSFSDIKMELSPPVLDVTLRRYARIVAYK